MKNETNQNPLLASVSEAVASLRNVHHAAAAAADHLTFSQRQSLRQFLRNGPSEALSGEQLFLGEDRAERLRDQVNQLGGAPEEHWTDDGHCYWTGGSTESVLVQDLVVCLRRHLASAWAAHDQMAAAAIIATSQGNK